MSRTNGNQARHYRIIRNNEKKIKEGYVCTSRARFIGKADQPYTSSQDIANRWK